MKKMDGKKVAQILTHKIASQISSLKEKTHISPCLAVVLIGNDPASQVYVKNKIIKCKKVGIKSKLLKLQKNISKDELKKNIEYLNQNTSIHAMLIQLPLPSHLNKSEILSWIAPAKDVDGLTVESVGRLWSSITNIYPCTPHGIVRLLEHYKITLQGKNVVVVGRSQIVGLPTAQLLLQKGATVTICHSKTRNLEDYTKTADIVVVACGLHHYLKVHHFKKGAVVIDVGIHRINKNGKIILEGDVCPKNLDQVIDWLSPVPGGVGPMTIALLLENTYKLTLQQLSK